MTLSRATLFFLLTVLTACSSGCPQDDGATGDSEQPVPAAPPSTTTKEPPLIVEEDGFQLLALADFVPFPADGNTWSEEAGVLICSGDPRGYVHSSKTYENFTLRADYRYQAIDESTDETPDPNTGFMIHIQEPHKVWPVSLEVQGKHSEMCSIKANGGAAELAIEDDAATRESARKPVGEWNTVEIISSDGALTARLNGEEICRSEPGELSSGMIGLQSEGFEVHFRNLRIREE